MSVYKKLQDARVKFHKLSLKKSGENKFAGYKYFELGDFLPDVQALCGEFGICGTIKFFADSAELKIVDVDNSEDAVYFISPSADVQLKGCLPIQGIGAAQTYLRRYLWVAAMEIVEHDVLDATTGKDEPKKAADSKKAGMSEVDVLKRISDINGAMDALAAKEIYKSAVKVCTSLGDAASADRIKAALLEKWTPVSAAN